MPIQVEPLHTLIGARVTGVDFREPLSEENREAIHDAWMKHLVLVFPDQPLSDEEHVAFTRNFGEPEIFHQNIIKSRRVKEIFRVSNVDDDGNLMEPKHPTMKQLSSAQRWHTDSSYREIPSMGALLHGVEVTKEGGVTSFTNMYAVLDALPAETVAKIEGKQARHDFDMLARVAGAKKASAEEAAAMPPVWQPMIRTHPVTGRKSLFISPIYNDKIEGMDDEESIALIEELAEFAGQEQFVYRHVWTPHDIVMWDNRCTMHYVTPHDPTERRVMHRTTIVGDGPVMAA